MKYTEEDKEKFRMFFLIKGHLDTSLNSAYGSYDGYFKRAWMAGSNGAPFYLNDSDFEVEWMKKIQKEQK